MDETNNSLEILLNLIYLAKHSMRDPATAIAYLNEAEAQVVRLAEIHLQESL